MTGTGSKDLWVGTTGGRVLRYDGSTWTTLTTRDTTSTIRGIHIAASDRVVLAGDNSIQLWDGARFTVALPITSFGMSAWGTSPNDLWVGAGSGCNTYHFDGTKWNGSLIPGCAGAVASIHGTSASDVYFVSEGTAAVFRWDGSKFNAITTPSTSGKMAVYATPTRVFVTSAAGEVLVNNGGTWTTQLNVGAKLTSIAGFSADRAWVGGDSGFVLSYKP